MYERPPYKKRGGLFAISYHRTHDIAVLVDLCLDNEISTSETIELTSSTITW